MGVLFKSAAALERAAAVTVAVLDKTGTVTEGRPSVKSVHPAPGVPEEELLTVFYSLERLSEHPLARAACELARERGLAWREVEGWTQLPGQGLSGVVDGKRCVAGNRRAIWELLPSAPERHSPAYGERASNASAEGASHASGEGASNFFAEGPAHASGEGAASAAAEGSAHAPGEVAASAYAEGSARAPGEGATPASGEGAPNASVGGALRDLLSLADALSEEGLTALYAAEEGRILGMIALGDTVKPRSAAAVKALAGMGVPSVMLTGDDERTARAVARRCGIVKVKAGILPQDKEREIRALQDRGHVCAMVGDGVNDAPALARADVGIAVASGTDVAVEAADVVLMKNDLADAAAAILLGRQVMRNIRQNLFWAFCYNVLGIPLAAGALYKALGIALNPMAAAAAMSLSSVCVVTNALRLRLFRPPVLPEAPEAASAERAADEDASAEAAASEGAAQGKAPTRSAPLAQRPHAAVESPEGAAPPSPEAPPSAGREGGDDPSPPPRKEGRQMSEIRLKVEGMSCGHCSARVEKTLSGIPGVDKAVVDLKAGTALVTLSSGVPPQDLAKKVTEAGYETTVL
jgi:cation transport ATPase